MSTPKCNIIDIGGDKYFMGQGKPLEYAIKTREEFNIAYTDPKRGTNKPHPRIPELMCHYFPFTTIGEAKKPEFDTGDIELLTTILNNRIKNLEESIKITNTSLHAQRNRKILTNLRQIVANLTSEAEKPEIATEIATFTKASKIITERYESQNKAFEDLLKFAWFMLHPDYLKGDVKLRWENLINDLKTIGISDVIEQIKKESKEEPGVEVEPLNYFSRIDLAEIVKEENIDSALSKAKDQAIADLRNKQRNKLAERLKSIATILQLHGYLSTDGLNKLTNTTGNSIDKFITDISSSLIDKIGYSFDPIFAYFKKIYDPTYSFIDNTVKNVISRNMKIPIDDIIHLINAGNLLLTERLLPGQSYASKYCIVRLDNVKPELVKFLESVNVEIDKELKKEKVERERSKFYRQLLSLPIVKPVDVASQAIQRMNALPIAGIFLGNQLTLPEEKDFSKIYTKLYTSNRTDYDKLIKANKLTSDFFPIGYTAMKDYFKLDSAYIVFGNYQGYPDKVPYRPFILDMNDKTMTKKAVEDGITKFQKENDITFSLHDIITNAGLYVNTSLLSMCSLVAFNQQLPTPKQTIEDLHTLEEEEKIISILDERKKSIKDEISKLYQIAFEKIDADTKLTEKQKLDKKDLEKADMDKYLAQIDTIIDSKDLDTTLQSIRSKFTTVKVLHPLELQKRAGISVTK